MKTLIGITIGDPKGIGPEIVAKAWKSLSENERASVIIYGDRAVLGAAADLVGTQFDNKHLVITSSTTPPVQNISDSEAARLAISAVDAAIADAASGRISALVTAPVNKNRIRKIHHDFTGHTEYLARAASAKNPVMMFASDEPISIRSDASVPVHLRVSLVTMHLPLKEVPKAITSARIVETLRQTNTALDTYFACPHARIAVMSLNPHSGEDGSIGTEEMEIIAPAIVRAQKEGINCVGPISPEKLFGMIEDYDYDAVVAMYHDQGLIPVKLLCQKKCVNITLGLPYVRTSPGHGTAEDIAWLGKADESGMLFAIRFARRLAGWKVER